LVATAHGNTLENLLLNPTLSDLVGGIHAVTLGDEEAKKRGTQKTVLERKAPSTFDMVIEIKDRDTLVIHEKVSEVVDQMLRGIETSPEIRIRREDGEVEIQRSPINGAEKGNNNGRRFASQPGFFGKHDNLRIFPYGVSRNRIEKAIANMNYSARIVRSWENADMILTLKSQEKKESKKFRIAAFQGIPVVSIKSNTIMQIENFLRSYVNHDSPGEEEVMKETMRGIEYVQREKKPFELTPQRSTIRRFQHNLVERHNLKSVSIGDEPQRRVKIFNPKQSCPGNE
jgi:hypothetical protein